MPESDLFSLPADMLTATRAAVAFLPQTAALPLDAPWAEHRGSIRDQEAVIQSYAWHTPVLAWLRVAHLAVGSRTSVLSLLVFPRLEYDLPLLGAEVVGINGSINLLVIDWVPMNPDKPHPPTLRAIRQQFAHYPNDEALPDWAAESFSPHLLYLRPKTDIPAPDMLQMFTAYLHGYLELCATATPQGDPQQTFAAQRRFSLEDMSKTPGGAMLARLFGEEWASAYAEAFLFRPAFD